MSGLFSTEWSLPVNFEYSISISSSALQHCHTFHQHEPSQQTRLGMYSGQCNPLEKHKLMLFYLGTIEICFGAISCIFAAITIVWAVSYYSAIFTYVSQGIWCGLFLIICGIFGVLARSNPSKCIYNANLALTVIAANFMIVQVILSSLAAVIDGGFGDSGDLIAFHSVIAVSGFVGLVTLVVHSAYCCAGICCVPTPMTIVHAQRMVPYQLPNGQIMLYNMPPGYAHNVTTMPPSTPGYVRNITTPAPPSQQVQIFDVPIDSTP